MTLIFTNLMYIWSNSLCNLAFCILIASSCDIVWVHFELLNCPALILNRKIYKISVFGLTYGGDIKMLGSIIFFLLQSEKTFVPLHFLVLGVISSLLQALYSGFICGARDQTQVGHLQGKCPIICTIPSSPENVLFYVYLLLRYFRLKNSSLCILPDMQTWALLMTEQWKVA